MGVDFSPDYNMDIDVLKLSMLYRPLIIKHVTWLKICCCHLQYSSFLFCDKCVIKHNSTTSPS